MRIRLMSDLHLESGRKYDFIDNTQNWDVLILSGDICVADHLTRGPDSPYFRLGQHYRYFFDRAYDQYDRIIYVAGNHEHYHGRFDKTHRIIHDLLVEDYQDKVYFMNNASYDWGGVRFIGTTLWTDVGRGNPVSQAYIKEYMNDYHIIQHFDGFHYRKLNPSDTMKEHVFAKHTISEFALDHDNVIVVTHHAPTRLSVNDKYKNDIHMNDGYYSDLSEFILDRPQIKLWTHGHMHDPCDYMMGDTRIACNPMGYPGENNVFDNDLVIEI